MSNDTQAVRIYPPEFPKMAHGMEEIYGSKEAAFADGCLTGWRTAHFNGKLKNKNGKHVIFDMDGTLSDPEHRRHLTKEHWPSFERSCISDPPVKAVVNLLRVLSDAGFTIWIVSARNEIVRGYTMDWMEQHDIETDHLIMRNQYDSRPDEIVKRQWLMDGTLPAIKDIAFVVDDRSKVVKMWRDAGLVCLQCAPGDF